MAQQRNQAKSAEQARMDAEVERLRSVHELYTVFEPRWDFYLSAYEGGEEFACAKNIFKHQRENNEDYNDRAKRVHNMNYCESLVDFFTNFIFTESIDRNGGSAQDWYKEFVQDVNRKGDGIDAFMREVCTDFQVYGICYTLVDAPPLPQSDDPDAKPIVTRQYEIDNKIRPYWVIIRPDEILDWAIDDFGNIVYAKRLQKSTEIVGGERKRLEKYTEFYPDHSTITIVDVTNLEKPNIVSDTDYPNDLGEIPLAVARFKRSRRHPHLGLSFLRDFAGNQREIINCYSMLQEFLFRQAFNILAMESSGVIAEQEEGDILVGNNNLLQFPKGATVPQYISPPAQPAQFISDYIQRVKNEMFLRAAQDAVNELFNGQGASGFSQAQSFYKTVPFISSRADELEAFETRLMVLTAKMNGKTWDGKIQYKDRYELTNLTDALTQFQILVRDLQIDSEAFVKTQLKRFIHQFDAKLPEADQVVIDQQIDDMDFTAWMKTQKEALVGVSPKDSVTVAERDKGGKVTQTATQQLRE